MFHRTHPRNITPDARLEYAAMLSGLSMAGDAISSTIIETVRAQYTQKLSDTMITAAPAKPSKR